MRRLAIEINDAAIVVSDGRDVLLSEPGYAAVDGRDILTGNEARGIARLRPRETSLTHWSRLSIEPGTATVPGRRSTAELAHAQLARIWAAVGQGVDDVVLVVPGTLAGESLGILLGLAEELAMPVTALVDAAVAVSDRPWPERQLLHVDADLHGVIVTQLTQDAERVIAEKPATLDSMGLAGVSDAFARRIAELFVLNTRFDPFHEAATEQRLYDALPEALATIDRKGRTSIELSDGDERFEIAVERADIVGAVQGFYRAVRQLIAQSRQAQSGLVIALSDRLADMPGFEEELARLDAATFLPLPPGAAASAALAAGDALARGSGGVKLYRQLRWRNEASAAPSPARAPVARTPAAAEPRPTHVVYRGIAYPVNGEGLVIGRSKLDQRRAILIEARTEGVSRAHCELTIIDGELRLRDLSSFGTFVNERRIDGEEVLKPADVIRVGSPGAELTVVRVED